MDEKSRVEFIGKILDTVNSLILAANAAGRAMSLSDLNNMSATHLIEIMVMNGIRFKRIQCIHDQDLVCDETSFQECETCHRRKS